MSRMLIYYLHITFNTLASDNCVLLNISIMNTKVIPEKLKPTDLKLENNSKITEVS